MKQSNKNQYFNSQTWKFILIFGLIFLGTFLLLYALNLVPKELISGEDKGSFLDDAKLKVLKEADSFSEEENIIEVVGEAPTHIEIPKAGVNISILNSDSTNTSILDEYLKKGVVRYPGSGLLGQGNMLLFGHSSNWKTVQNSAYKALNNIWNLEIGDEIYVKSETTTYVYKVRSVKLLQASNVRVDFSNNENILTLSTCNTFGAKEDRYVVEADFDRKI